MRKFISFITALTLGGSAAFAQANMTLDYEGCLAYALEHNIQLRQSRLTGESTRLSLDGAKAQWQPTLDAATTQGVSNHPWGQGNKTVYSSNYALSAGWTVYNGGQRENTIRRYETVGEMNRFQTLAIERNLQPQILQLYLNILYAAENIDICRESAAVSAAQAERGKALMESGRISRVDYAQLESQARQDDYAVVSARANYDSQLLQLKSLLQLGIDTDLSVLPYQWTDNVVTSAVPSKLSTYDLAVDNDPSLAAARTSVKVSDYDIELAKASGRPSVGLTGGIGVTYNAPGQGAFGTQLKQSLYESLGVTLSVPIFNQKKTKTAVAIAQVDRIKAVLDEQQRLDDLSQEIESWYIDLESARSRFISGLDRVSATRLSDELVNEQFELGLVNTVELMQAHNDYSQARRELLQAKYMAVMARKMIDYYRTTSIALP